jgi:hypothetical protein
VRALLVALDQETLVLRLDDRGFVVIARERLDRVERLLEREGEELRQLAQRSRRSVQAPRLPGVSA